MKLSARNQLKGRVTAVKSGAVMAEVEVQIEPGQVVAAITDTSREHLELREGDEVAGFTVLDTPGHSVGHVSYWRESDRTLICGDVFTNMDTITGVPGLQEPKRFFTPDPARNRQSMRRLAELEPALVCFGHGRPLRDPAKLSALIARLEH